MIVTVLLYFSPQHILTISLEQLYVTGCPLVMEINGKQVALLSQRGRMMLCVCQ